MNRVVIESQVVRPLGVWGIVIESLRVYWRNFWVLIGIAIAQAVPYAIYSACGGSYKILSPSYWPFLLLGYIVSSTQTLAIATAFAGRKPSIVSCFRRILSPKLLFPVLAVGLLSTILILPQAMLPQAQHHPAQTPPTTTIGRLALPMMFVGYFFLLKFMLAFQSVVIEQTGAFGALKRSWDLMRGNISKTFCLLLAIGAPVGILAGISLLLPSHVITNAVFTLLGPIFISSFTLLYFDIRCRKEGFTSEALAKELDSGWPQLSTDRIRE